MSRILIIEDERAIAEVEKAYIEREGFSADIAGDGLTGLAKFNSGNFDLVLLDLMLPGMAGADVCSEIRRVSDIPVIFITAKGREQDILHGYELGCDDYILKPFLLSALYAKCLAMVKRTESGGDMLECGAIRLDTQKLACFVNGNETELTPKCFALLRYLMEHKNWVISRDMLLDRIWGADYFGSDRVVDNHIKKLRKALGSAGKQIRTVITKGYQLTE